MVFGGPEEKKFVSVKNLKSGWNLFSIPVNDLVLSKVFFLTDREKKFSFLFSERRRHIVHDQKDLRTTLQA